MKKFSTIVADPPWPYNTEGPKGKGNVRFGHRAVGLKEHYNKMSIDNLCSLSISRLCNINAHLYLWTTNSFMEEAHWVAKAWGFVPKTIITWVKVKKDGWGMKIPSMKTGFYFRSCTEHILFCVRGSLRLSGVASPTAFMQKRLPHSVKPDFFYKLIEQQSPGPYLELFARRLRDGWDSWGNEIESTVELKTRRKRC